MDDFITKEDVRKACKELGITDWSKKKKASVTINEAKKILKRIDTSGMKVSPANFRTGLEVELEHGTMFPQYNVTNNHPILTGMIVMAHFMEMLDYYQRLEVAELEGDIIKAVKKKNMAKVTKYYKRLAEAKGSLASSEIKSLK